MFGKTETQRAQKRPENESQPSKKRKVPSLERKTKEKIREMESSGIYDQAENAILDYLQKKNFNRTFEMFRTEMQKVKIDKGKNISHALNALLEAFDKGNHEAFFKYWELYVPYSLRNNNEICEKLEFYVEIYFVVYSIHPSIHITEVFLFIH